MLIEGSNKLNEFADKSCREKLIAALPGAMEPLVEEREAPLVEREAAHVGQERRRAAEIERAVVARSAETPCVAQVARKPGKRAATAVLMGR